MSYLLGLIGHPVQHSLSQAMHEAALLDCGLEGQYDLLDVPPAALSKQLSAIAKQGYFGLNVTIPHKEAIVPLCSKLTAEAAQARAVNTIRIEGSGSIEGHNTDIGGFMSALGEALPRTVRNSVACVMGSGGAARAALWGLSYLGWQKIQIVARNAEAAEKLAFEIEQAAPADERQSWPRILLVKPDLCNLSHMPDLLINTTPVGVVSDEPAEWMMDLLKCMDPNGVFFDMVYSVDGKPTPLVQAAHKLRIFYVDGTDMLVQQAALSFKYWTGKRGPVEVMKKALTTARLSRHSKTDASGHD